MPSGKIDFECQETNDWQYSEMLINSRIILFFSIFSETERRFRKQIDPYKFREDGRDKLWLLARIPPLLGVMRHI